MPWPRHRRPAPKPPRLRNRVAGLGRRRRIFHDRERLPHHSRRRPHHSRRRPSRPVTRPAHPLIFAALTAPPRPGAQPKHTPGPTAALESLAAYLARPLAPETDRLNKLIWAGAMTEV